MFSTVLDFSQECLLDQFPCEDGSQCIEEYFLCNEAFDCDDLSDEKNCSKLDFFIVCNININKSFVVVLN